MLVEDGGSDRSRQMSSVLLVLPKVTVEAPAKNRAQ